jgi:hypothetical protein
MEEPEINSLRITPDTTTCAWKDKLYRQDNSNKNFCIYQGNIFSYEYLCSSDFPCDSEFMFTIKAVRVRKHLDLYGKEVSSIAIGLMES